MESKRVYKIEFFRGSIRPENRVSISKTTDKAWTFFTTKDRATAQRFADTKARMRGLIATVTFIKERS